jgi:hypothetical protein
VSITFGSIVKEGQEHSTSIAMFMSFLAMIETWMDNIDGIHTLGIILNQFQWAAQEYTLSDMDVPTVSIASYANDYERHFPFNHMRDVIARCRELQKAPLNPNDDGLLFILGSDRFVVMTLGSKGTLDFNSHLPVSAVFGDTDERVH